MFEGVTVFFQQFAHGARSEELSTNALACRFSRRCLRPILTKLCEVTVTGLGIGTRATRTVKSVSLIEGEERFHSTRHAHFTHRVLRAYRMAGMPTDDVLGFWTRISSSGLLSTART